MRQWRVTVELMLDRPTYCSLDVEVSAESYLRFVYAHVSWY